MKPMRALGFGIVTLLAIWSVAATCYVAFHDRLLASLIARQVDLQYSYEDRIAALETQLDRETSRGASDRKTLETTLGDLAARGARLEAEATEMDALVGRFAETAGTGRGARSPSVAAKPASGLSGAVRSGRGTVPAALDARGEPSAASAFDATGSVPTSPASASPALRLNGASAANGAGDAGEDIPRDDTHAAVGGRVALLRGLFAGLEARHMAAATRLGEPVLDRLGRLRTALSRVGMASRLSPPHGLGGPFVPLRSATFEQTVGLLKAAIIQERSLSGIVDRVPLRNPVNGLLEITSPFGPRLDPFFGRAAMHTGVDLHESTGDLVAATADGTVTLAGPDGGYGNLVEIDHGNGFSTRYAHLSAITVVPHQTIEAGAIIGRVGSTGRSTGPHLHYETRIDGTPVDPTRFLDAGRALFAN